MTSVSLWLMWWASVAAFWLVGCEDPVGDVARGIRARLRDRALAAPASERPAYADGDAFFADLAGRGWWWPWDVAAAIRRAGATAAAASCGDVEPATGRRCELPRGHGGPHSQRLERGRISWDAGRTWTGGWR